MITKAVIVAAGKSSRLYPLTLDKPKGLLPVGGQPMLARSVSLLRKCGIVDIGIVVGYRHGMIREALGDSLHYISNPFFEHCNNMGSLWFAKDFIGNDPVAYFHGDIVYDEAILKETIDHAGRNSNDIELVTDFGHTNEEAMKVRVTEDHYLIESNKEIPLNEAAGEWTGMTYINNVKDTLRYFEKVMFNEGLNFYDTHAFTQMAKNGHKLFCSSTRNLPWVEIDFLEDYERAKEMFR